MTERAFERAVEQGLIGTPMAGGLTIDPLQDPGPPRPLGRTLG